MYGQLTSVFYHAYEGTFVPSYATFESTEVLSKVRKYFRTCTAVEIVIQLAVRELVVCTLKVLSKVLSKVRCTFVSCLIVFGCRSTTTTLYSTFFELSSKAQLSTFEGKKLRCTRPNCGLVRNIFFSCSDVGSEDAYIVRRCLKTKLAKILKLFSFASL